MRKLRMEVGTISPETYNFYEIQNYNAYCCISLFNQNFYGKRLGALLDFLNKNFNKVIIITLGYLYRHNYKIINNCDENEALKLSMEEESNHISQEINNYIEIISNPKFQVTSWTGHLFTDEFKKSTEAILNFYNNNSIFKEEIDAVALNYLKHSKLLSKSNDSNLENNLKSSINFLLEEAAFMNYIIQKGFPVEIYPGRMVQVFNDIASNRFQDAPEGLKKRIFVPLRLKRMGNRLKTVSAFATQPEPL